jgi:hypothetical protein
MGTYTHVFWPNIQSKSKIGGDFYPGLFLHSLCIASGVCFKRVLNSAAFGDGFGDAGFQFLNASRGRWLEESFEFHESVESVGDFEDECEGRFAGGLESNKGRDAYASARGEGFSRQVFLQAYCFDVASDHLGHLFGRVHCQQCLTHDPILPRWR